MVCHGRADREGQCTLAVGGDRSSPVDGLHDTVHFITTCQKMVLITYNDHRCKCCLSLVLQCLLHSDTDTLTSEQVLKEDQKEQAIKEGKGWRGGEWQGGGIPGREKGREA